MSTKPDGSESVTAQPTLVFAMISLGFSGTMFVVMCTAVLLQQSGYGRSALSDSLGRMIFSYGCMLDVVAVVFGLISVTLGGRSRRLGILAITLTLISFLMLFAT
jgi:hypothetical protein